MSIYITGIGVISAIGNDVHKNLEALKQEASGIKKHHNILSGQNIMAGLVDLSNEELINLNSIKSPFSRTSLLGLMAAKEAWGDNKISDNIKTGIISATTVGCMDKSENYYANKLKCNPANPIDILTHDSGNTTEKIAKELGISGYVNTLSTACSSAANAIMLGARLIKQNKLLK